MVSIFGLLTKTFLLKMKTIILCVIIWTVVVIVADMNWPAHMGGSSDGLVNSILNLLKENFI